MQYEDYSTFLIVFNLPIQSDEFTIMAHGLISIPLLIFNPKTSKLPYQSMLFHTTCTITSMNHCFKFDWDFKYEIKRFFNVVLMRLGVIFKQCEWYRAVKESSQIF